MWGVTGFRSAAVLLMFGAFTTPLLCAPKAHADNSAAHAIAQRFSDAANDEAKRKAEAEAKQKASEDEKKKADAEAAKKRVDDLKRIAQQKAEEARRKAEEAEMLARAAAEAREREIASKKAEEERLAAERHRAAAAEEARQRDAALKAETERLVREAEEARRAEEVRLAEEERKAEEAPKQTAPVDSTAHEPSSAGTEVPTETSAITNTDKDKLQSEREDEIERLAEKLRKVREGRPEPEMGLGGEPYRPRPLAPVTVPGQEDEQPAGGSASRVTVLLSMEPGDRGIRRFNKTADPVLCLGSQCYVSAGPGKPAIRMSRGDALGPTNTLGSRAGACRQMLNCVFRDIELPDGLVQIQPIDLRYLRHDRRQALPATGDSTCRVDGNQLSCTHPLRGKRWQAWVVPEDVAKAAGTTILEAASKSGLNNTAATALHDPLER